MLSKKVVISFLVCSTINPCLGMETFGNGVKSVTNALGKAYTTVQDKADPLKIFKNIDKDWNTSVDRIKITKLHKLDRGFADGLLKMNNLANLLDEVESTHPKYTICPLTIDLIYAHLESKITILKTKKSLLMRAITAMYLLKPNSLAPRIKNNTFVNNVDDATQRENIIGTTMTYLIELQDSKGINSLIAAIQENEKVALGATAKKNATIFLGNLKNITDNSLIYLLDIKKDENKENNNNQEEEK